MIAITGMSDRHRPDQPIAVTGVRTSWSGNYAKQRDDPGQTLR